VTLLVKICGLTDRQHLQVAIDAGANAVGFVFADSVRRIAPDDARSIGKRVPPHIKRVAVMMHPSNDEWQQVLKVFNPDILQTDADDYASLEVPEFVECWPVYREDGSGPKASGPYVYEGSQSSQGATVDWSRAASYAEAGQMILAGGLDPENVTGAVRAVRPFGVDVSSGVESQRGNKDAHRILEFIKAARAAENDL
jgi:phosphoribosylanthranilate isomerase